MDAFAGYIDVVGVDAFVVSLIQNWGCRFGGSEDLELLLDVALDDGGSGQGKVLGDQFGRQAWPSRKMTLVDCLNKGGRNGAEACIVQVLRQLDFCFVESQYGVGAVCWLIDGVGAVCWLVVGQLYVP
jgi:hypothetical protein